MYIHTLLLYDYQINEIYTKLTPCRTAEQTGRESKGEIVKGRRMWKGKVAVGGKAMQEVSSLPSPPPPTSPPLFASPFLLLHLLLSLLFLSHSLLLLLFLLLFLFLIFLILLLLLLHFLIFLYIIFIISLCQISLKKYRKCKIMNSRSLGSHN